MELKYKTFLSTKTTEVSCVNTKEYYDRFLRFMDSIIVVVNWVLTCRSSGLLLGPRDHSALSLRGLHLLLQGLLAVRHVGYRCAHFADRVHYCRNALLVVPTALDSGDWVFLRGLLGSLLGTFCRCVLWFLIIHFHNGNIFISSCRTARRFRWSYFLLWLASH